MSVFGLCFLLNCFAYRVTSNVHTFALTPPETASERGSVANFKIQRPSVKTLSSSSDGETGNVGEEKARRDSSQIEKSVQKKGFWARMTNKRKKEESVKNEKIASKKDKRKQTSLEKSLIESLDNIENQTEEITTA